MPSMCGKSARPGAHRSSRPYPPESGARLSTLASVVLLLGASSLAACASAPPRVVSPTADSALEGVPSAESKDVEVMHLRRSSAASQHLVTLRGAEAPHVHDRSDLTVFVLRGSVMMHFQDRAVKVGPGDVVDIPMGVFHWAENIADEPSLAYAVYSPAFDGKDRRPVPATAARRARSFQGMVPSIAPAASRRVSP